MPRYELIEGSSKKFWEISLEGSSFTTTYGRIGTDGQSSLKEYESDEQAQREYEKLIAEKTKKGYGLVGGNAAARPAPAPAPVARPSKAVFEDEGDDEEDKPQPKKAAAKKAEPRAPAAPPKGGASKSGEEGARYFEFVDGSSSKIFREIKLEGTSFTTRYGKIGTDGQISMKEYESAEKTKREYDKLVAEKTRKGYVKK